jgi:tripartite-type tricarboxylate transporter receptor subunit TctC
MGRGRRQRSTGRWWAALIVPAVLASTQAPADPVADFYKGRTINLIIGSGEGGGFDIGGRLAAEFLSRTIPGHPAVVPQDMPGAAGIRAAEYMARVALQDGTVLSVPQPSILINKIVDGTALYAPEKFNWIGRFSTLRNYGVVWHTAPVQTIAAAKTMPLIVAAAPGVGSGTIITTALNQLVGTKLVVVHGYKSVSESGLAMERGEVQGISSLSWEYLKSKGWTDGKLIRFLYSVSLARNPNTPDTPTVVDLADRPDDKDVLRFIASETVIGRTILAPPNVPADRIEALRAAFSAMLQDPDFIRASAQRQLDIDPLPGAELQHLIADTMNVTPKVADTVRRIIQNGGSR